MSADGGTPDDGSPEDRSPGRRRVTFGPGAVAVGFLVGLTVLALAFASSWGAEAPRVFLLALWYGVGIGLVTGLPLGIVLGLLLRPVSNQWIHVAIFFVGFAMTAFLVTALLSPSTLPRDSLPTALVIGGAAAMARASIWRMVREQ
ncbi:hypothetical protein [Arthrobacter sp. B0490]|uniref:hypothetical protein n=1 Tax=Arthrobacter sp. B0490 TaxID=2058891 RepID=UPI0011AFFD4F|nr:hypothetical protein [Arthrobacter sp. B0490]